MLGRDTVLAREARAVDRLDRGADRRRERLDLVVAALPGPLAAARRRKPLEQHLREEVVRRHVRLLDQLRHRRRGDRGQRLGLERRRREVRAADLTVDPHAPLAQGALQSLGGYQLGRVGVIAPVVAVVERQAGERAQVGPRSALAIEDRVVGEDPALDTLHPGGGDVASQLRDPGRGLVVGAGEAPRAERGVAVADEHQIAPDDRITASPELPARIDAGLEPGRRPQLGEQGRGHEQLLVRGRDHLPGAVVAEQDRVTGRLRVEDPGPAGGPVVRERRCELVAELAAREIGPRGQLGARLGSRGHRGLVGAERRGEGRRRGRQDRRSGREHQARARHPRQRSDGRRRAGAVRLYRLE